MTNEEAVILIRIIKAACPAQKFDEFTPDIWARMLAGVEFDAAERAIIEVGKRQPWIGPSDIIAEVRNPGGGSLPYHRPMREVLAEIEQQHAVDSTPLPELER